MKSLALIILMLYIIASIKSIFESLAEDESISEVFFTLIAWLAVFAGLTYAVYSVSIQH
jgi:hypothetical protein